MSKNLLLNKAAICFLAGIATVGFLSACGKSHRADSSSNSEKQEINSGSVQKERSLGDLSAFKKIAEETLDLVDKGQLAEAKAKVKELETEWDKAEESMKPLNTEKWNSLDKSIDRALGQLRTAEPNQAACSLALKKLIAKFAAMSAKLN